MFERLKQLLSQPGETAPADTAQKNRIAACVLLLEAAHVDGDCTLEEMDHVVETLKTKYEIPEDYLEELIELAHAEREKAIDLGQFTNHLNQTLSRKERLSIMEDVWRVIHADGMLERHEDHFAHKLANLLRLTHSQLIEAKVRAREQSRESGQS